MIELIFVIVILGILSAIALPKMIGTQKSAIAQKVESFVATCNRTVLPAMYVSALRDGGSITSLNIDDYISLPSEVSNFDLTSCGSIFTKIADTDIGASLFCRDGNGTNIPLFAFTSDGNTTLDSSYFR